MPENFHLPTTVIKTEPLPSAPLTLELHGYSKVGNVMQYSFYDTRSHSSYWVSPGDKNPDIQIVSDFDPGTSSVEILARGREVQVKMVEASTQAMAAVPSTPPLVVYSPYDSGSKSTPVGGQGASAPSSGQPTGNPVPNQRGTGQGRGFTRGNVASGQTGAGSRAGAGALNPGGGTTATRRAITQPGG